MPPPHAPVTTIAIDVTVTPSPNTDPNRPASRHTPISKAHLDSLRRKLNATADAPSTDYFEAILNNRIMLLPFTIDPFGGLGYHAHLFLYGTEPTKTIKPPDPPPLNSGPTTPHGKIHYDQLQAAPTGLLPKATKAYTPPPTNTTNPPFTPSRWAHQLLALNISTFLARHFHRSLASATRTLHDPDNPSSATLGSPPNHQIPTTILDPLPMFLQAAA